MTLHCIDTDTISQIAAEILQKSTECKKPIYLHIVHTQEQNNDKVLKIYNDKPPHNHPSIVATPNDTQSTVENRVARLYKL